MASLKPDQKIREDNAIKARILKLEFKMKKIFSESSLTKKVVKRYNALEDRWKELKAKQSNQ